MLQAKPSIIALSLWPPRLRTVCHSLHLAGRRSPQASLLSPVQTCLSRFGAAGSSPEGAAAPMARQSRFHDPCLKGFLFQPLAAGRLFKQGPRDWLCQTAGAAAPSGDRE